MLQHWPRDFGQFHAPNFVGTIWGWPLPVPTWLCTNAQTEVNKDMDDRVWCGWTWPPNLNLIEHLWDELEQRPVSSFNISVWPHKYASGRMVKNSHTLKHCVKAFPEELKLLVSVRYLKKVDQHHIKPCGLRMGCRLSSYASQDKWPDTFGNIVFLEVLVSSGGRLSFFSCSSISLHVPQPWCYFCGHHRWSVSWTCNTSCITSSSKSRLSPHCESYCTGFFAIWSYTEFLSLPQNPVRITSDHTVQLHNAVYHLVSYQITAGYHILLSLDVEHTRKLLWD